jgi:hypothetical protein
MKSIGRTACILVAVSCGLGAASAQGATNYGIARRLEIDADRVYLLVRSSGGSPIQACRDELDAFLKAGLSSGGAPVKVEAEESEKGFRKAVIDLLGGRKTKNVILATGDIAPGRVGVSVLFKLFRVGVESIEDDDGEIKDIRIMSIELLFADRCEGPTLREALAAPQLAQSLVKNPHMGGKDWLVGTRVELKDVVGQSWSQAPN